MAIRQYVKFIPCLLKSSAFLFYFTRSCWYRMKKPVFRTWSCCTGSCKQILVWAITSVSDMKDLTYISLYSGLYIQPWDFSIETQAISKNTWSA